MIILIANKETHRSLCTYTNVTHISTSVFSEHCGPQIIGILVFMLVYLFNN